MIVSTKTFGIHIHRSRGYVWKLVKDMERMGYPLYKDGRTTLFDEKDAAECLQKRRENK